MTTIHVLWVDDEWLLDASGAPSNAQFDAWAKRWGERLAASSIEHPLPRIARSTSL